MYTPVNVRFTGSMSTSSFNASFIAPFTLVSQSVNDQVYEFDITWRLSETDTVDLVNTYLNSARPFQLALIPDHADFFCWRVPSSLSVGVDKNKITTFCRVHAVPVTEFGV